MDIHRIRERETQTRGGTTMNQTQQQIEKLRSLQESLDWAIDLAENQLPELKTALQEIKDKVSNITIDLSPVAKEETLLEESQSIKDKIDNFEVSDIASAVINSITKDYKFVIIDILQKYGLSIQDNADWFDITKKLEELQAQQYAPIEGQVFSIFPIADETTPDIRMTGIKRITAISSDTYRSNTYIKTFSVGGIVFCPNLTSLKQMFENSTVESVDLRGLNTSKVSDMSQLFNNTKNLVSVDLRGVSGASLTSINAMLQNANVSAKNRPETLVGDASYEDICNQNIGILVGLNASVSFAQWMISESINHQSWRALINGLADRTGQDALKLTLPPYAKSLLNDDDKQVAYNKNWTIE